MRHPNILTPLAASIGLLALGCGSAPAGTSVSMPGGEPGIGFDDLRYSPTLGRVLAPGGRAGNLSLVDPASLAVTAIGGFSANERFDGGHDDGPTSVDEGRGYLFVTDRTSRRLHVVDPATSTSVASVPLASGPDYVRYVAATDELWVTEPSAEQIEIFSLAKEGAPVPSHAASIAVSNGPESMVIDASRGRAYTHRWQASTLAIDTKTRAMVGDWPNGCASSRGIALDEARGFLLVGCLEGTASVVDVAHDGKILSTLSRGAGFDVIGYSPKLGHLYLAGGACGCLVTLGVSASGQLSFLDRVDAPADTHCVTADDRGNAWVCDPAGGKLWRVPDAHPASL